MSFSNSDPISITDKNLQTIISISDYLIFLADKLRNESLKDVNHHHRGAAKNAAKGGDNKRRKENQKPPGENNKITKYLTTMNLCSQNPYPKENPLVEKIKYVRNLSVKYNYVKIQYILFCSL